MKIKVKVVGKFKGYKKGLPEVVGVYLDDYLGELQEFYASGENDIFHYEGKYYKVVKNLLIKDLHIRSNLSGYIFIAEEVQQL